MIIHKYTTANRLSLRTGEIVFPFKYYKNGYETWKDDQLLSWTPTLETTFRHLLAKFLCFTFGCPKFRYDEYSPGPSYRVHAVYWKCYRCSHRICIISGPRMKNEN